MAARHPQALPVVAAALAEAFEDEFWSGRCHRGRLVAAPLRALLPHLPDADPDGAGGTRAWLEQLAAHLEAGSSGTAERHQPELP